MITNLFAEMASLMLENFVMTQFRHIYEDVQMIVSHFNQGFSAQDLKAQFVFRQ